MKPTEVRPKVYADADGEEWRAVEGKLEARLWADRESEDDELVMEPSFGPSDFSSDEEWLEFLRTRRGMCFQAALLALANPMTRAEADADNEQIAKET